MGGVSFILPLTLLGLAAIVSLVAGIWLLVLAFRKRVWWGLAVLFIPMANIVFMIMEWAEARRPFYLSLLAIPLLAGAFFAVPKEARDKMDFARQFATQGLPKGSPIEDEADEDAEPEPAPAVLAAGGKSTAPSANVTFAQASKAPATGAPKQPEKVASSPAPQPRSIPASVEAKLAELQDRQALLLARKKRLKPNDQSSALALSQEIVAYNAELQAALSARERLVTSGALTAPAKTPAAGQIAGLPFTVEKATLRDGVLTLRQGGDFFADREVSIFLFLKDGESPAGRKWQFGANKGMDQPHVHLSWRENGQELPKTKIFMSDYQLNLEFDRATKDGLAGRIVLTTPDEKKSTVNGTFTAQLESRKPAVASSK